MIAHGGVEENLAQVGEVAQKEVVFSVSTFQIAEKKEGLGAALGGFLEGPGNNARVVVTRVAADGETGYAWGRLIGQRVRVLVGSATAGIYKVGGPAVFFAGSKAAQRQAESDSAKRKCTGTYSH